MRVDRPGRIAASGSIDHELGLDIAEDWQALARFYQQVFGCVSVREVDFQGDKLDAGVRVAGAHLCGVHMRLPGHGDSGPTIEIFNYVTDPEGNLIELLQPATK